MTGVLTSNENPDPRLNIFQRLDRIIALTQQGRDPFIGLGFLLELQRQVAEMRKAHNNETGEPLRDSLQAVEALTRYASGTTPDQQRLAKVCQIARMALRTPSEKASV